MRELRYCGTETEFSVDTQKICRPDELVRIMFTKYRSGNLFLPATKDSQGGARWYIDLGSHPEYSTAEHTSTFGAVQQEVSGEDFAALQFLGGLAFAAEKHDYDLIDLAQQAKTTLEITKKGSYLSRDSEDFTCWSVGHHENYMIDRAAMPELSVNSAQTLSLATHLITRQIFTGGGGYLGEQYFISPRSQFICEELGEDTMHNRPIINTRDIPLASNKFRRLHVITGDDNISPWALAMKLGTTRLVCRAIESDITWADLYPEKPVKAMRAVGMDQSLRSTYPSIGGINYTAISAQSEILKRIEAIGLDFDDEEQFILENWKAMLLALDKLPEDSRNPLLKGVDWITRRKTIDKAKQKGRSPYQTDNDYSRIVNSNGKIGTGRALRRKGYFPHSDTILDSEQPLPLRPRLRGIVSAVDITLNGLNRVSWEQYKLGVQLYNFPDFPTETEAGFIIRKAQAALEASLPR